MKKQKDNEKHLLTLAAALMALTVWAQSPEDTLEKMSKAMEEKENDGMTMTIEMKIPILGTMHTRVYSLGDKSQAETKMMGREMVIWDDVGLLYTHDVKENELSIEKSCPGPPGSSFRLPYYKFSFSFVKKTADDRFRPSCFMSSQR